MPVSSFSLIAVTSSLMISIDIAFVELESGQGTCTFGPLLPQPFSSIIRRQSSTRRLFTDRLGEGEDGKGTGR